MQSHDNLPLTDFIEYPQHEMLRKAEAFYHSLQRRHSIRSFSDRDVPRAIIENCIKAAGTAPSGANHQPWHFSAIHSPDIKRKVREHAQNHEQRFYNGGANSDWLDALKPLGTDANKPYLETAPWLIAIFSQKKGGPEDGQKKQNYYIHESVGIATGMLITALHTAGLATLTHTPKPMGFLADICQRPDDERAYMLIVAGYPSEDATIPTHAQQKKPIEKIATFL